MADCHQGGLIALLHLLFILVRSGKRLLGFDSALSAELDVGNLRLEHERSSLRQMMVRLRKRSLECDIPAFYGHAEERDGHSG